MSYHMILKRMIALGLSGTLLAVSLTGCTRQAEESDTIIVDKEEEKVIENEITEEELASTTVSYQREYLTGNSTEELPVFTPLVEPYQVEPGLENVVNADQFYFQEAMVEKLVENKFLVQNSDYYEFFDVYEGNRYAQRPNFVTVDSMMHTYHLFFAMLQKNTEKQYLYDKLCRMTEQMYENASEQHRILTGTKWEEAADMQLTFLAVAGKLLDLETDVPDQVAACVKEELELIEKAEGIDVSPLTDDYEDYSQYKPRGYYEGDELLEKYFKAMMWYGRRNFRQTEQTQNKCAVLLVCNMNECALEDWRAIYTISSFFAGESDDNGYYEYMPIISEIYGEKINYEKLVSEEASYEQFCKLAANLPAPQINSEVFEDDGAATDKLSMSKGYRLMGQRFSIDEAIFTKLCYGQTKENSANQKRMLPDALDVPATLGSEAAYEILKEQGDTEFAGYTDNMNKLREMLEGSKQELFSASLYAKWLDTLSPLLTKKEEGYPSFMTSKEWEKKSLETYLGSYTELKHDTILYSKQMMAEMGGGDMEELDDRGYVEPEPVVFAKLAALTNDTKAGLKKFGVISANDEKNLEKLSELANQLSDIAVKELTNKPLSEEEYELIRSYGGTLEHFWKETLKDYETEYITSQEFPAALVADVATDPNGSVLEEAIGGISSVYVIFPLEGKLRIAEGGVYSYYQFKQPIDDRLTDSAWRRKIGMELGDNDEYVREDVAQPEWTQSYRCNWVYDY